MIDLREKSEVGRDASSAAVGAVVSPERAKRPTVLLFKSAPSPEETSIKRLFSQLLGNQRDTFKDWLRAVIANEINPVKANPIAAAKAQKQLDENYRVVLQQIKRYPDVERRLLALSKLACINFVPEAEAWLQRADSSMASAQLGVSSSTERYEVAEECYAKALFHYRDLIEKYREIEVCFNELHLAFTVNMEQEMTQLVSESEQTLSKLYKARLHKHLNHILLSLTKKVDPAQLLFSAVSLCNLFVEYTPEGCKAYDKKGPVRDQICDTLEKLLHDTLMNFADLSSIQKILDASQDGMFRNLLDALHWTANRGSAFVIPVSVREDLKSQSVDMMMSMIDEVGEQAITTEHMDYSSLKLSPMKQNILRHLRDHYQELKSASQRVQGDGHAISQGSEKLLLEFVKTEYLSKNERSIVKFYPSKMSEISVGLWMLMLSVKKSIVHTVTTMAKGSPKLAERLIDKQIEHDWQDYLRDDDQYDALLPETRRAAYNVLNAILTNKLWFPEMNYDENALNPVEIDARPTVFDSDLVEQLSHHPRSSMLMRP